MKNLNNEYEIVSMTINGIELTPYKLVPPAEYDEKIEPFIVNEEMNEVVEPLIVNKDSEIEPLIYLSSDYIVGVDLAGEVIVDLNK